MRGPLIIAPAEDTLADAVARAIRQRNVTPVEVRRIDGVTVNVNGTTGRSVVAVGDEHVTDDEARNVFYRAPPSLPLDLDPRATEYVRDAWVAALSPFYTGSRLVLNAPTSPQAQRATMLARRTATSPTDDGAADVRVTNTRQFGDSSATLFAYLAGRPATAADIAAASAGHELLTAHDGLFEGLLCVWLVQGSIVGLTSCSLDLVNEGRAELPVALRRWLVEHLPQNLNEVFACAWYATLGRRGIRYCGFDLFPPEFLVRTIAKDLAPALADALLREGSDCA